MHTDLSVCNRKQAVTLSTILRIIHLWSIKTPVGKMASELSVSKLLLKHVASNKKLAMPSINADII